MSEYPFLGLEAWVVVADQIDQPRAIQAVARIGNTGLLGERQFEPARFATKLASIADRARPNGGMTWRSGAPRAWHAPARPAGG